MKLISLLALPALVSAEVMTSSKLRVDIQNNKPDFRVSSASNTEAYLDTTITGLGEVDSSTVISGQIDGLIDLLDVTFTATTSTEVVTPAASASSQSSATVKTGSITGRLSNGADVTFKTYLFDEGNTYEIDGEDTDVPEGSFKWTIDVSGWPQGGALSSDNEIVMQADLTASAAASASGGSRMALRKRQTASGDVIVVVKGDITIEIPTKAKIDGQMTTIDVDVEGDSKVTWTFPKSTTISYDPTVTPKQDDDEEEDSSSAALPSFLLASACAVAAVFL